MRPAPRAFRVLVLSALTVLGATVPASAQLGSLLSPGPLARAHAQLEGLSSCRQCHEQGRKVTATKCLACHKPIADRMAKRTGVHKDVRDDCVTCHAEHAGVNGELRPFAPAGFDHAVTTGFALDGKHASLSGGCAACHKERSYLTARTECASCHKDVHNGRLGQRCQTCHSTRSAFTAIANEFDHTNAAFRLTGAHRTVTCEKCHMNRNWKGLAFGSCASCHKNPHSRAFSSGATSGATTSTGRPVGSIAVPADCTSCHTTTGWRTQRIDHARTAFPLVGKHQTVACAACHRQPAMRTAVAADRCGACHADVHRGTFTEDCKACHTEAGFDKARFDHTTTKFVLTGRHAPLECEACHKTAAGQSTLPAAKRVADFRGLASACASCHDDVHRAQLGTSCDACHTSATFKVQTFTHKTAAPAFFGAQHAALTCEQCHTVRGQVQPVRTGQPVALSTPGAPSTQDVQNRRYRDVPTACATCHDDVHLGQEGEQCESCHTLTQPKFALPGFVHAKTSFPLTGKHESTPCALCHTRETGSFPAGSGTAVRFRGVARECGGCHADVHLGQVDARCDTCHSTAAFHIEKYRHLNQRALGRFFVGQHATATCQACHKPSTGAFPAGRGIAVRFAVGTACVGCHTDIHRGALGPDCASCHKP